MAESVLGVTQSFLLLQPRKLGIRISVTPSTAIRFPNGSTRCQRIAAAFCSGDQRLHFHPLIARAVSSDSKSSQSTIINDNVDLASEDIEVETDTGGGGDYDDRGEGGGGSSGGGGGDNHNNEGEGESGEEDSESKKKMALSMSQKLTLGYAALVGMGGLMGYMKSGSQKSLLSGGVSAALLYYVYTQLPTNPVHASSIGLGVSSILAAVMTTRFLKSKKIFPAGVVSLVSLVMTGGYVHGIMRSAH